MPKAMLISYQFSVAVRNCEEPGAIRKPPGPGHEREEPAHREKSPGFSTGSGSHWRTVKKKRDVAGSPLGIATSSPSSQEIPMSPGYGAFSSGHSPFGPVSCFFGRELPNNKEATSHGRVCHMRALWRKYKTPPHRPFRRPGGVFR